MTHYFFSLLKFVEDEDSITMLDVLKDSEAMEEDAKAVLGNADDQNCSYHSGGEQNH